MHSPRARVIETLRAPAVSAVLVSGFGIALLVGLLMFESGREIARSARVAEQKLADLNRDLEIQVAERTWELERRATDLETITDSVAHDLRNPLNAIGVNAELLQQQTDRAFGQAGADSLVRIRSAVGQMAHVLNRLLRVIRCFPLLRTGRS